MNRKKGKSLPHRWLNAIIRRIVAIVLRDYYSAFAEHWHPHHAMREEALKETVAYIKASMPDAMIKKNALDVLSYAGRKVTLDGLFLEFGVRTGETINHIAKQHPGETVFGFDSFEGLPEDWSGWFQEQGVFATDTLPAVRENAELVVGWFDETLPSFVSEHPSSVAFVHIDSDIYASAKVILDTLAPQIRPGTIIVFNEYFNYPNWQQHEFKAFQEFCGTYGVEYDYLCWGQFEVAVRIARVSAPEPKTYGAESRQA